MAEIPIAFQAERSFRVVYSGIGAHSRRPLLSTSLRTPKGKPWDLFTTELPFSWPG
jgi:hypothetical protein